MIQKQIEYIYHPWFDDKEKSDKILSFEFCHIKHTIQKKHSICNNINYHTLFNHAILTREAEQSLFLKMNCVKYFTVNKKLTQHEHVIKDIRDKLILHNMQLIPFSIRYAHRNDIDISIAISEGSLKLFRAIEMYNVGLLNKNGQPYKFSTYAMQLLYRYFRGFHEHKLLNLDNAIDEIIQDDTQSKMATDDLFRIIENIILKCDKREQYVILNRFGINDNKRTLSDIGNELGITKERVRQIQLTAIRKIRKYYFDHYSS